MLHDSDLDRIENVLRVRVAAGCDTGTEAEAADAIAQLRAELATARHEILAASDEVLFCALRDTGKTIGIEGLFPSVFGKDHDHD